MKIQVLLDVQPYQLENTDVWQEHIDYIFRVKQSRNNLHPLVFSKFIYFKMKYIGSVIYLLFWTLSIVRIYKNHYVLEVGSTSISIHIG